MRRFAIGDIHGCARTFRALLKRIDLSHDDELYLLGDYIDRGPDSRGVLDLIMEMRESGYRLHGLRGNHEQALLDSVEVGWEEEQHWLLYGGDTTLASFGIRRAGDLPAPYVDFLRSLPFYLEVDEYILVHAGLNFRFPNPLQDPHAQLWIRDWYEQVNYQWLGRRIILHGHTPAPYLGIQLQLGLLDDQRYLDLDCGCVFAGTGGMGYLVAFDLDRRKLFFQKNVER